MGDKMATREAYGKTLVELGKKYSELVVLDGDLSGSTKTAMFAAAYPERFFNMGIAEQDIYGTAAGLAVSGKKVCASTFAMFATGRAFEIIRNSIGYTGADVNICATHAGITVGGDGASHQTFEDIALMRTIPGMRVIVPCDGYSAGKLLEQAVALKGPCYLRFGRAAVPAVYDDAAEITLGKGSTVRQGSDAAIIATGIMVTEALTAADMLAERGIQARVIDMHTIKPIDEELVIRAAEETGAIVTAEEHSVIGGLGEAVAAVTAKRHPVKISMVGQQDVFGESGEADELKKKYGMTAENIVLNVEKVLK